ncbi:hypothetical protein Pint_25245 [Pistacia integerrima]|uniref:Uncharacterized protein n=1 Tax=Pistacia integerrima TaxID=434235 RepID=A0ACC0YDB4_9ROSI|nr:hypothetical protein Pint_25245 [Pistacia integerrima]
MRGSELFTGMKLLKFSVFFQYVPRVIRIYPLFMKATRISDVFDEAIWAKAAFNLLLYMLAGHVFGALWYYFAIERLTVCWKNACINHTGCSQVWHCGADRFSTEVFTLLPMGLQNLRRNWQRSAGEIEPELQDIFKHGASALVNVIQGVRSSERALPAPSQQRSAEPEINIEEP